MVACSQVLSSEQVDAVDRLDKWWPLNFLRLLGSVGTAAMIWVGSGILLHGIQGYGWSGPSHLLHDAGAAAQQWFPAIGAFLAWLVQAAGAGLLGLIVGALAIPAMGGFLAPVWRTAKARLRRRRSPPVP